LEFRTASFLGFLPLPYIMKTSIILVAYNSAKDLEILLPSFKETETDQLWSDLIVIDNGSDNSLDIVKKYFPEALTEKSSGNIGYAAAANRGVALAFERGAEAVIIMNTDMKVLPNFFSNLVKILEDKTIGCAQSLLLRPNIPGSEDLAINSAGNIIHPLGIGFCDLDGRPINEAPREITDINYPSGSSLAVTKEVWQTIGGLNEKLFLYHEDLEFGLASLFLGLRNVLAPSAKIIHYHKFRPLDGFRFFYMERNRYLVWLKAWRMPTIVLLTPFMLLAEIGLISFSLLRGQILERPKIWLGVVKAVPEILKQRKSFARVVSDRSIMKQLKPIIRYQPTKNFITDKIFTPGFRLMKGIILLFLWW